MGRDPRRTDEAPAWKPYFGGSLAAAEQRKRVRWISQVRWGFLVLALAYACFVVIWSNVAVEIEVPLPLFLAGLPLFVLAYNLLVLLWLRRPEPTAPGRAATVGVLGDLAAITLLLFGTGGYGSWSWSLYPIASLEAAYLFEDGRKTLAVSVLGTLGYGAVLLIQHQRWLPVLPLAFADSGPETPAAYLWIKFAWEALLSAAPAIAAVASLGMLEQARASLQAAYHKLDEQYAALNQLTTMKTSFLSTISHELRTPLAVMQGYAELVEEDQGLSPESRAYLLEAETGIRVLTDKINLMLAYTALAAGEQSLTVQSSSVSELLNGVAARFEEGAVRIVEPLPERTLHGDPVHLSEAIVQLVRNALSVNPAGVPPALCAREARAGLMLGVLDQGPGLPEQVRSRLGEPFIGASTRLSEHQPGLGLGLAYASLVAQLHGGHVGATVVDSPSGSGHCVYVYLPVSGAEPDTPPQPPSAT